MHVESTQREVKKVLDFEKGYCSPEMIRESTSNENNTLIHVQLDPYVFSEINVSSGEINNFLK